MERVYVLKGCTECWHKHWGTCCHPDMNGEACPHTGFMKNCPLPTTEAYYAAVKTCKYYDDTDW
jgi:hypothetical protein